MNEMSRHPPESIDPESFDVILDTCDTLDFAITIADPQQDDCPLIYANAAFLNLTGYEEDEVLGRNCRFLQGPETQEDELELLRARMGRRRQVTTCLLNRRKDGSEFSNMLVIDTVRLRGDRRLLIGCQYAVDHWIKARPAAPRKLRSEALLSALETESQQQLRDAVIMRSSALATMLRAKLSVLWARRGACA